MPILRQLAGKVGNAISQAGNAISIGGINANQIAKYVAPNFTLASTLQNYGGNLAGTLRDAFVPRQAYANETGPVTTQTGGTSQNPYSFPTTTEPDNITTKTGGGAAVGTNIDTSGAEKGIMDVAGTLGGNLDRDYEDAMASAQLSENSLNRQGSEAVSSIQTQGEQTKEAARQEALTAQQGVDTQQSQATKTYKAGTMGARDLFRDTQQRNVAQLSSLGISSSSVTEALAERLGVEMARRIAGLSGSYEEVTQNLVKEGARIKDYAAKKIADVENSVGQQLKSIQGQILEGINQIGLQRQMAATAKANARADLIAQAQTAINNLRANAQTFAQQMQAWAQQKASSLADVNKEFTISQGNLGAEYGKAIASMPQISGFQYIPSSTQGSNQLYKMGGSYVKNVDQFGNIIPQSTTVPTTNTDNSYGGV